MAQLISKVLKRGTTSTGHEYLRFKCPGCKRDHMVYIGPNDAPRWDWNGNPELPTLYPSIKATGWVPSDKPEEFDDGTKDVPFVCHSYVTTGEIIFLGDSTHALANTTVKMVEYPDE